MTREEAITLLEKLRTFHNGTYAKSIDMAIEALQAEALEGEWIRWVVDIEDDTGVSYIPHSKCSNCGTEQDSHTTQFINFCPNCGAYMAKENEK